MSLTVKQKQKMISRAIKKMDEAAEALSDLQSIAIEYGVDISHEQRFRDGLMERAGYWEKCTWWKK